MMPSDDIGYLIKLIDDCIEKDSNQRMKELNLTFQQARILLYLNDSKGQKITQKDLEEYFAVSHPTIVGLLKRLEEKGFLACYQDKDDRRMKIDS